MDNTKEQFFNSLVCLKKAMSIFSSECEMQINELTILQNITGKCSKECTGVNLDVPDIQDKLHITKPAVSYILNALEKKEYIERQIDSKDRRKISVTATPKGMEAAEESIKKYDEAWDEIVDRFGEQDMITLIGLLNRLSDICEEISLID